MARPKHSRTISKQSFRVCFCFRRIYKLRAVDPPEDVKHIFKRYSSENGTMTVDDLQRFLIEYQKEPDATKEDAQAIFNSVKHLKILLRKGLHLEAFFHYLLGDLNPPLKPRGVHNDMKAPLAHYYMYTGHNSYLTGNQISSDSSEEPIIRALQKGVRVIELDLWPNNTKDDIQVCHGGTLTSPVELIKCLCAIKDYAFVASEYPVVITFEDHLTPDLQAKVAKMVTKTFGDMLYCPDEELHEFPSPESLKKRVMISTKPPKEYLRTQSNVVGKTNDEQLWEGNVRIDIESITEYEEEDNEVMLDEEEEEEEDAPEYKRLIAIHAGKPKGSIGNMLSTDTDKVRRLSLSEQQLEDAVKTHSTDIIRFTHKNLLRIYPKGLRLDSSNYNPLLGWTHGAQMVAFNMQGYGKYLWMMQGMFRANGGCGYVKKPDFLLKQEDGPTAPLQIKTTLRVSVYMGEGWHLDFHHTHFDTYSPPDFYTRIGIAGVAEDSTEMQETRAVEDDWTPVWNDEFEFRLRVPELALLRIEVLEYDTSLNPDFGGQTCLPVSDLRSGIRAVPLHHQNGDQLKSVKLLLGIQFISVI